MACELAEKLNKLGERLGSLDISGVDPLEVDGVLVATERCRRALAALDARLHACVPSSRSVRRDRMRSDLNLSTCEADRRARAADTVADMPAAGEALAAGRISDSHVDALAAARSIAGERLDEFHVERLLADAADLPADKFRSHAVDIARQLCADGGEAHHDNLRRRRALRWWRTHDGMTRLTGDLDPDSAAVITKAVEHELHARWRTNNPTGHAADGSRTDTIDARRLDALVGLCAVSTTSTSSPSAGIGAGTGFEARVRPRTEVGVLVDYETLSHGLHAKSTCHYDTGDPIPPSLARTFACDADIYPALLDSASEILDLGRTTRVPNRAQRRALNIRDRGCAHPSCGAPPAWCDAHHVIEWWGPRRGPTHLDNLVLLCRHHHTQLHRQTWNLPPPVLERANQCIAERARAPEAPNAPP